MLSYRTTLPDLNFTNRQISGKTGAIEEAKREKGCEEGLSRSYFASM
jgi:hypothetical protein